jgi:hypothetical protein
LIALAIKKIMRKLAPRKTADDPVMVRIRLMMFAALSIPYNEGFGGTPLPCSFVQFFNASLKAVNPGA